MRLQLLPLIIIILINIAADYYIYKEIINADLPRWMKYLHLGTSALLFFIIIGVIIFPKKSVDNGCLVSIMWMLFTYMLIYLPKYFFSIFSLLGRLSVGFINRKARYFNIVGIIAAVIVFVVMLWSGFVTPRSIDVKVVNIESATIPKEFNGFKILQFSDVHLGTYGSDTAFVADVVDKINSLQPDVIFFTGDLVNRQTSEALPFVNVLKRLKAPHGVYSILGNHDYGDYMQWKNANEKRQNNDALANLQKRMGWNLLTNDHSVIKKGSDSIIVIGVENWGENPFPKYGDLAKSYKGLNDVNFKILLSHNPMHWRAEVIGKTNIDLMLAGHTHAMQMQMSAFGKTYSPSSLRYPEWSGLYTDGKQNLYVNIGLGEVAFPMRIGATPEITLVTLTKKNINKRCNKLFYSEKYQKN